MKKVTMMVLGLLMTGALLSGCYSTSCAQPDQQGYKDSAPSKAK